MNGPTIEIKQWTCIPSPDFASTPSKASPWYILHQSRFENRVCMSPDAVVYECLWWTHITKPSNYSPPAILHIVANVDSLMDRQSVCVRVFERCSHVDNSTDPGSYGNTHVMDPVLHLMCYREETQIYWFKIG